MAIQRLAHVGLWVDDLQKMTAFYTEVMGLQITDATGPGVTPGAVFLSSRPDRAHHELALMSGRTNHDPGLLINQISWMCESLEDLQEYKKRLQASAATFHEIAVLGGWRRRAPGGPSRDQAIPCAGASRKCARDGETGSPGTVRPGPVR